MTAKWVKSGENLNHLSGVSPGYRMTKHDRRTAHLAFHARKAGPSEMGWKVVLPRF